MVFSKFLYNIFQLQKIEARLYIKRNFLFCFLGLKFFSNNQQPIKFVAMVTAARIFGFDKSDIPRHRVVNFPKHTCIFIDRHKCTGYTVVEGPTEYSIIHSIAHFSSLKVQIA